MNTYATRANAKINQEGNGGAVPQGWQPLTQSEGWQRKPIVLRAVNPDGEMRRAVREALVHHLQEHGMEWVLGCIADALTNHAIRRLNTEDENRLRDYNRIREAADLIARLPERTDEWEDASERLLAAIDGNAA